MIIDNQVHACFHAYFHDLPSLLTYITVDDQTISISIFLNSSNNSFLLHFLCDLIFL